MHTHKKLLCVDVKTIAGGSYYGVALAIGNTTIVASQVRSVALTYSCPKQLIGLEHRLAVVESVLKLLVGSNARKQTTDICDSDRTIVQFTHFLR